VHRGDLSEIEEETQPEGEGDVLETNRLGMLRSESEGV
jgi:hypothetical protein